MKKLLSVLFCVALCMSLLVACGTNKEASTTTPDDEAAADETYTYTYEGAFGEETVQFVLKADGTTEMSLPGNEVVVDVYAGTYEKDGDKAVIKGLSNVDASSEYKIPGLWDWIDATTGDAEITLNADGTFAPANG
jgi:hypothetical protein